MLLSRARDENCMGNWTTYIQSYFPAYAIRSERPNSAHWRGAPELSRFISMPCKNPAIQPTFIKRYSSVLLAFVVSLSSQWNDFLPLPRDLLIVFQSHCIGGWAGLNRRSHVTSSAAVGTKYSRYFRLLLEKGGFSWSSAGDVDLIVSIKVFVSSGFWKGLFRANTHFKLWKALEDSSPVRPG